MTHFMILLGLTTLLHKLVQLLCKTKNARQFYRGLVRGRTRESFNQLTQIPQPMLPTPYKMMEYIEIAQPYNLHFLILHLPL